MDVKLHNCFVIVDDHEKAIAFYRDVPGFEVRTDVSYGGMRWVSVGSPAQPDVHILLEPPAADPGISPSDRAAISDLLAKGLLRGVNLSTSDLEGISDRVQASGADVVQEPMDMPYGTREFAVRDPAGNLIRFIQTKG
jgi:predicted enzyme related to lactoylglutathione lyase